MEEIIQGDNQQYTDCYIAFLDLLGFKNVISRKCCADILKTFKKIRLPIEGVYMGTGTGWEPIIDNDLVKQVKIKIISDSICFYIDASIPNSFCVLLAVCLMFQVQMAQLDEPVLMRGGIVRGELYAEGDITFGPGLTKAYLLEEKCAKTPRIIITGDVLEKAWEETDIKCRKIIHDYVYRDEDAFYILNYLGMLSHGPKGLAPAQYFYDYVIKILNSEIDPSVMEKYLYLEKYMKIILKAENGQVIE